MSTEQNAQQPGLLDAIQAAGAKSLESIRESALGQALGKVWDGAQPSFEMGAHELASAIFRGVGADAYVMYPRNSQGNEQEQGHGLSAEASVQQPEQNQQQDRGGMGR